MLKDKSMNVITGKVVAKAGLKDASHTMNGSD